MKLIGKWKDFYDYLQGIYGVDEKLILDRTEFIPQPYLPSQYTVVSFFITDYLIEGVFLNGEWLYGKEIEPHDVSTYWELRSDTGRKYYRIKDPSYGSRIIKILKQPTKYSNSPNERYNCPILIASGGDGDSNPLNWSYTKNPILREYNIHKIYDAHTIWIMLSEWLAKQKDKVIPSQQTDKEKIISAGFDLKSSFRH